MDVRFDSENSIVIEERAIRFDEDGGNRPENRYARIVFQNGTVAEAGENGCQVEDVLEAALMRIRQLNEAFPCRENALAVTNVQQGLMWLQERTRLRQAQGVEGQHVAHDSAPQPVGGYGPAPVAGVT